MDPVDHYLDEEGLTTPRRLQNIEHLLENVWKTSTPVNIWKDGVKVAVAIHPEEFDLLERLVRESRD